MFKIIDCSQIFHVISKIKSSNYTAHAYFSIQKCASTEWILMEGNLRASVFMRFGWNCMQLYLLMRSSDLAVSVNLANRYVRMMLDAIYETTPFKKHRRTSRAIEELTNIINHNLDVHFSDKISQFFAFAGNIKQRAMKQTKICKFVLRFLAS
jgi:hypothetical protein